MEILKKKVINLLSKANIEFYCGKKMFINNKVNIFFYACK